MDALLCEGFAVAYADRMVRKTHDSQHEDELDSGML